MNPHYRVRVNEAVFELADLVINANGYATAMDESDQRANDRDELVNELLAVVARHHKEPTTGDELIAAARKIEPDLEASVGVTEDATDPNTLVLAACEVFWGNGSADDQAGATDTGVHTYRVDRWIVETNDQGFRNLLEYPIEAGAIAHMDIVHNDERFDEDEVPEEERA